MSMSSNSPRKSVQSSRIAVAPYRHRATWAGPIHSPPPHNNNLLKASRSNRMNRKPSQIVPEFEDPTKRAAKQPNPERCSKITRCCGVWCILGCAIVSVILSGIIIGVVLIFELPHATTSFTTTTTVTTGTATTVTTTTETTSTSATETTSTSATKTTSTTTTDTTSTNAVMTTSTNTALTASTGVTTISSPSSTSNTSNNSLTAVTSSMSSTSNMNGTGSTTVATQTTTTVTTFSTTTPSCSATPPANLMQRTGTISLTFFAYNYTANSTTPTLMFGLKGPGGMDYVYLDSVSVVDISAPSIELLENCDFENSTSSLPTGWTTWCTAACSAGAGQVTNSSNCYSGNCYVDHCQNNFDYLVQSFSATIGHIYNISFWLKQTGGGLCRIYANIAS